MSKRCFYITTAPAGGVASAQASSIERRTVRRALADFFRTDSLIVACVGALLGGVIGISGQRYLESRKAKRDEAREDTASLRAATNAARVIGSKLANARETLEAIKSEWPQGDQFALDLGSEQFSDLEGYLDGGAWVAITEAQARLESVQIRRELIARDPKEYAPDGEISRKLLVDARQSLVKAESALQPFVGNEGSHTSP